MVNTEHRWRGPRALEMPRCSPAPFRGKDPHLHSHYVNLWTQERFPSETPNISWINWRHTGNLVYVLSSLLPFKWMWVDREFRNNVSKHTCVSYTSNIYTSVFHSIQQCHSRLWFSQCQIMSVCFTFSCWSNRCGLVFVKCAIFFWLLKVQRQLRVNVLTETRAKHLGSVTNIGIIFKGSWLLLLYTLADCVIRN